MKKKNVNNHESTHTKKKKIFLSKIKRQIFLLFYVSCLNQGMKDGSAVMFSRNP